MAATVETTPEVGTAPVCRALGLARATVYRRRRPPATRMKRERPSPARALSTSERQAVLEVLHSKRFCDQSPREVHATLLEEERYLCAPRTMYRLLAAANKVRERRDQLRHPRYSAPELLTTKPNQVLEYFDKGGQFHYADWNPEEGRIHRSRRFDERNAAGLLAFTSVILDARKVLNVGALGGT